MGSKITISDETFLCPGCGNFLGTEFFEWEPGCKKIIMCAVCGARSAVECEPIEATPDHPKGKKYIFRWKYGNHERHMTMIRAYFGEQENWSQITITLRKSTFIAWVGFFVALLIILW